MRAVTAARYTDSQPCPDAADPTLTTNREVVPNHQRPEEMHIVLSPCALMCVCVFTNIFTEICEGGELFDRTVELGALKEADAANIIK